MKLTGLKITDFMGIKAAEMALEKPINVFAGRNEAGKSSIRDAVLWAMTGNARALKNEDARAGLIRAGAKAAEVAITFEDNGSGAITFTRRKTPKSPGAVTGDMPIPLEVLPLPVLFDTHYFFEMAESARRELLFKLIPGLNPTPQDLMARAAAWLKTAGVPPTKEFQFGLQKLMHLAAKDGFKAAEGEAVTRRREAKRARDVNAGYAQEPPPEFVMGETTYILPDVDKGAIEINLKTNRAKRDELLKAAGRKEAQAARLQEAEKELAAAHLALPMAPDAQTLEDLKKAVALATGAWGDASGAVDLLKRPTVAEEAFPQVCPAICGLQMACPNAGVVAVSGSGEAPDPVALEEAEALAAENQAALDRAETALKEAQAQVRARNEALEKIKRLEDEVKALKADGADLVNAHAAQNLEKLEKTIVDNQKLLTAINEFWGAMDKANEARAMVEKCEAEIAFYDALQKGMAPAGIPSQMISEALAPVNELLAVAAAHLFPGRTLTLTPELSFALEGSPLLSKSAELRVGVAIQYVLAKLAGARLLLVDEVDMLDPANRMNFIRFLMAVKGDFDRVLAFTTAASATPAPVPDIQMWWVEQGAVAALN